MLRYLIIQALCSGTRWKMFYAQYMMMRALCQVHDDKGSMLRYLIMQALCSGVRWKMFYAQQKALDFPCPEGLVESFVSPKVQPESLLRLHQA